MWRWRMFGTDTSMCTHGRVPIPVPDLFPSRTIHSTRSSERLVRGEIQVGNTRSAKHACSEYNTVLMLMHAQLESSALRNRYSV